MKIVYLSPLGHLGGAEVCLLDIFASLRRAAPELELHLIAPSDGPLVKEATALNVPSVVIPFPPSLSRLGDAGAGGPAGHQVSRLSVLWELLQAGPGVIAYIRKLRGVLFDLAPDVIHTNGFKMHVLGTRARPAHTPVIWHIHDYVQARPVMARALRWHSRGCTAVVANSQSVAEDVRRVCGKGLPVQTIYNGVDLDTFSPQGPELDLDKSAELPPAAPGTVRVGLLATLARWKGQTTFLEAFKLLPPELPVRGYIIGGALYQTAGSQHTLEELKERAAQLGLSERVGFTGFVDSAADAMRSLDVVVHASTEPEPFGLVIAEAMACGRAVIASQAGGAAELIESGVNALGHSPGDAATLARRITELTTNSGLRQRLGQAARRTAEKRFDRARFATELLPLYQAVASQSIDASNVLLESEPLA